MDQVFTIMSTERRWAPRLRAADTPQRFEFPTST